MELLASSWDRVSPILERAGSLGADGLSLVGEAVNAGRAAALLVVAGPVIVGAMVLAPVRDISGHDLDLVVAGGVDPKADILKTVEPTLMSLAAEHGYDGLRSHTRRAGAAKIAEGRGYSVRYSVRKAVPHA